MFVYHENMKDAFEKFKDALNCAQLISFDCEMTGISRDFQIEPSKFDTQQFNYAKCREVAKQFELIQVGVTFIIPTEEIINDVKNQFYMERTFTFFLFKNSNYRYLCDIYSTGHHQNIFGSLATCHPEALKFLNDNKFDFNTIVGRGMNYNRLANEGKIRSMLLQTIEEGRIPNHVLYLSHENEEKILDVVKQIVRFFIYGYEHTDSEQGKKKGKGKGNDQPNLKILKISNLNKFLISYLLGINFKNLTKFQHFNITPDKSDTSCSTLTIEKSKVKLNCEDFVKCYQSYENFCLQLSIDAIFKSNCSRLNIKADDIDIAVQEELGFSRFIQLIINKQTVPILGHHLFFDLLFIYEKFIDDLPESFYVFKQHIHKMFPVIYDNKMLAHTFKEFSSTRLEGLIQAMKKMKYDKYVDFKPDIDNGFCLYQDLENISAFHDAGFDSIVTGRSFIYLLKSLENDGKTLGDDTAAIKKGFADFEMKDNFLGQYENKTVLNGIEYPHSIVEFNLESESEDEFYQKENTLISTQYNHVFVVILNIQKDEFIPAYEFARLCHNEIFNLTVIKIDDHVAFVKFFNQQLNLSEDEKLLQIQNVVSEIMSKYSGRILSVIPYSQFAYCYKDIIKF